MVSKKAEKGSSVTSSSKKGGYRKAMARKRLL